MPLLGVEALLRVAPLVGIEVAVNGAPDIFTLLLFSPDASSASSLFAVSPFPSSRANSRFGGIGYFSASSEGAFCISFSRSKVKHIQ